MKFKTPLLKKKKVNKNSPPFLKLLLMLSPFMLLGKMDNNGAHSLTYGPELTLL